MWANAGVRRSLMENTRWPADTANTWKGGQPKVTVTAVITAPTFRATSTQPGHPQGARPPATLLRGHGSEGEWWHSGCYPSTRPEDIHKNNHHRNEKPLSPPVDQWINDVCCAPVLSATTVRMNGPDLCTVAWINPQTRWIKEANSQCLPSAFVYTRLLAIVYHPYRYSKILEACI